MQKWLWTIITICLMVSVFDFSQANEINDSDENFKMLTFDLGYGARDLSIGAGFRWNYIGLDINLAGFISSTPRYIYPSREFLYPKQSREINYPSTTVSINGSYYYDINEISLFVTVGYFSQTDSVLVQSFDEGITNGVFFARQYPDGPASILKSGICFGLGGQYFINEMLGVGIGYHTKKGVYLQLGYYWY